MNSIIDSHIHFDQYEKEEQEQILNGDATVAALISVSFDLSSCKKNIALSKQYDKVYCAFGYHPEQKVLSDSGIQELFSWMEDHRTEMTAIGEVGLPYYTRTGSQEKAAFDQGPYLELLEEFIKKAGGWKKPIVLHAVYDDAPAACDLLEKHSLVRAHFHWFKGDQQTIARMIANGYFISVTPDVVYEEEIKQLVKTFPLQQMMVETDGPWPFEGPFQGKKTTPSMIHTSIKTIAAIKKLPVEEVYKTLYENTINFYNL
ncbi:TatD family hydrolase [Bacillaceae bacterium Marseille-Q3522]|nr:TatD family hydrolase [Bacillaceae bacterium Marseille-Q3522]